MAPNDKTMADALATVRAAKGKIASIIADRAALKQQVADLLAAQGTLTPEVQAGLNEIFDTETQEAADIDAAMNTNPGP